MTDPMTNVDPTLQISGLGLLDPHTWVAAALNGSWQGIAVTAVVILALRVWQRSNASTRFALWGATLFAVLALPLLNILANAVPTALPQSAANEVIVSISQGKAMTVDLSGGSGRAAAWSPSVHLPRGGWSGLVIGAWAVATLTLLFRLASGYWQTLKLRRDSVSLAPRYQHRLNVLAARCKVDGPVVVRGSYAVASPVVVGLLRHMVLLPAKVAEDLTFDELDQVFLHELAHLRRRDHWWNILQGVATAVGCGIPAIWWICRRMDLEREIACDDWVVTLTGRRKSYASCLLRLVQLGTWARVPMLVSGAAKGRSQFGQRIFLLLDRHRNRGIAISRSAAAAFFSLVMTVAIALSACANPFAPPRHKPVGEIVAPAPDSTTPELLIHNLHRAMRQRDKDLYENLIDHDFWFTELDCRGEFVLANGREEELEIMGTRDGSSNGILDIFDTFDFNFAVATNGRTTELARDYPEAFPGDPDGHPGEDWEVFRGRTEMLMVDHNGDGFRVDQVMTYKLRRDGDGVWRMIRWSDDPLSGDCGGAEVTAAAPRAALPVAMSANS